MLEERSILPGEQRLEISVEARGSYRLAWLARGEVLVEYWSDGARHRRRVRGREGAYAFRSVEQLRYDFERDAADAQPQG